MRRCCLVLLFAVLLLPSYPGVAETLAEADQLVLDKNYTQALEALDGILSGDPGNGEAYAMKLRIRFMALQDSYRALNDMIAADSEKADDRSAYLNMAKQLYAQAALGIVIPFRPDYASPADINYDGTLPMNLSSILLLDPQNWKEGDITGVFAAQGDWVYFVNAMDNFSLWKVKSGGGSMQRILPEAAGSLNVIGDWIYYRAVNENNAMYKARTDGSEKTLVTGDNCANLYCKGEWIYYQNAGEDNAFYKISPDGSGREYLNNKGIMHFLQGDYLYYSTPDDNNLLRMNIMTLKSETLLKKQWHVNTRMMEGQLYTVIDRKGMLILRMNEDGSEKEDLMKVDGKPYCYAVQDGRLVLSVRLDVGERVMIYDMETMKDPQTLMMNSTDALCMDARGRLYALNPDGLYLLDLKNNTAVKVE